MAYRETVLVTGAAGGIGTHLVKELLRSGFLVKATDLPTREFAIGGSRVRIVKGDLADRAFVRDLPLGVDHVIHAGAATDATRSWSYLETVNVEATRLLWERSAEVGVERFVFVSSGSVYKSQDRPIVEEDPQEPFGNYERSKFLAEKALIRGKHGGAKTRLVTLRPGWVIGPFATALMASVATIPPLYKHYLGFAIKMRGGPRSNMVHSLDVARAALHFLEKGEDGGIYNLANDDVLEFADYFNIACQEYGLTVIPGIPVHIPGSAWFRAFGPLATRPEPIHLLNRTGERLWERLRKRYDLVDALHPRMDLAAAHHAAGDLVLDTTKAREAGFETIFPDYRSAIRDVLERYQKVRWIP
jgi:UDP-glucose 4-epimerase